MEAGDEGLHGHELAGVEQRAPGLHAVEVDRDISTICNVVVRERDFRTNWLGRYLNFNSGCCAKRREIEGLDRSVSLAVLILDNDPDHPFAHLPRLTGEAPGWEVIVVDDASSDRTCEAGPEEFPGVRFARREGPPGFCHSVNFGMSLAGGDILLLLNNDVSPRKGAVAELARALESAPDSVYAAVPVITRPGMPDEGGMTKNAEKRLEAIQTLEELGSGFYLAMHDLEIRGAGEVLGEAQSGNMHEVGFDLYTQMLNAAVRALRSGREPDLLAPLQAVTEINLHAPALLPSDYVNDVHQRLSLYKKLASCNDEDGLLALQEELVDRYGKLPEPARALIETHRLRLAAEKIGVKKIDASGEAIVLTFVPSPPIDPARLIALIQREKTMRLAGQDKLRIDVKTPNLDARLQQLRAVFKALSQ